MLSVKYGLITLIRQQADLCEQIKTVDEECPLDGEMFFRKEVDIPEKIPPVSSYLPLLQHQPLTETA